MPTLNWIGKDKIVNHHLDVPYRVLNHRYGFKDGKQIDEETKSGNMIIQGDNLDALKALLPKYEGRIKCIYIDPPYNTGNESWIYNDNVNDPKIKKWLGTVVGPEGEDLSRHDKWLCMMYPRLRLLDKLLSIDGVLVISIGYQEVFNLMNICKDIFGDRDIHCVTVQTSGGKPSGGFNYQHEYLIFIVPKDFVPNPLSYTGGKSRSPFEGMTLATFTKVQRPNQAYPIYVNISDGSFYGVGKSLQQRIKEGDFKNNPEDFIYDYVDRPEGTVAIWPVTSKGKDCVWRLIPSRLKDDWEKGYIKISVNNLKTSNNRYSIQYLPSGVINKINSGVLEVTGTEAGKPTLEFGENKTVGGQIPTIWNDKAFYTVKGTSVVDLIFGGRKFNYPKPIELISEVIKAITSEEDIILDSFAGSGTTAHAVLNLNKQDGCNRKFILVELGDYADSITAERNKRAIQGYGDTEGIGGAFDFYNLGSPLFYDAQTLNEEIDEEKIREYVWYTETQKSLQNSLHKNQYFLGSHNATDYYFFYKKDAITTLDYAFLATFENKTESYIVYADQCALPEKYLLKNNIIFKKIPRDISKI